MTTNRMMGLALAATLGLCAGYPAVAADRDAVAAQVAEMCRKLSTFYSIQETCRQEEMTAFDKLQKEDEARAKRAAQPK
jgi:hypothetical protein